MDTQNRITLDKAERSWLNKIKQMEPEYEDLEFDHVFHVELKKHLTQRAREIYLKKRHDQDKDAGVA